MSYPKETKDFYFFRPAIADREYLYIRGGQCTPELQEAIRNSGVATIVINRWEGKDLEFLAQHRHQIKGLSIVASVSDISIVSRLYDLESLGVWGPVDQIDFARLKKLRRFGVESRSIQGNVAECTAVEELTIVGCQISDLGLVSKMVRLRSLELQEMPLTSLRGIEALQRLEKLHLGRVTIPHLEGIQGLHSLRILVLAAMRKLESIAAVTSLKSLRELCLSSCKRIRDLGCIDGMTSLQRLTLEQMGLFESLKFLLELKDLEQLDFSEDTNIVDGDLDVLLRLPKLGRVAFRNRRHYSRRHEELNLLLQRRTDTRL